MLCRGWGTKVWGICDVRDDGLGRIFCGAIVRRRWGVRLWALRVSVGRKCWVCRNVQKAWRYRSLWLGCVGGGELGYGWRQLRIIR